MNILRARGYNTTIEHARHYLDTQRQQGHTVEEVRANQIAFQLGVLKMQIEQEAELNPNELVFLDRAIPDALAYYRFLHMKPDNMLLDALKRVSYRMVFLLDPLPLVHDYARTEDSSAQMKLHELLNDVYRSFGFPVVRVAVADADARVDMILRSVS